MADSGIDISEITLEELMRDMPGTADVGRSSYGEPQLTKEAFSVSHLIDWQICYLIGPHHSLLDIMTMGTCNQGFVFSSSNLPRILGLQALLRGTLQNEEVMLAQLEGALSDMQQSFRLRNRFRQLAMLVIARTTPVSELQGLRELFQRLDVDNSGLLSLEELRRGLRHMDSEVQSHFQKLVCSRVSGPSILCRSQFQLRCFPA